MAGKHSDRSSQLEKRAVREPAVSAEAPGNNRDGRTPGAKEVQAGRGRENRSWGKQILFEDIPAVSMTRHERFLPAECHAR